MQERDFEKGLGVDGRTILENRILGQIFGLKRNENGEWRRLHNEELHSL